MPGVEVTTREGKTLTLDGTDGLSVMEVIRDGGVDEMIALCGGCCSCATCHVIVDAGWFGRVGEPNSDEDALLDSSDHRDATSRLSCQIRLSPELDGLQVTIAPED